MRRGFVSLRRIFISSQPFQPIQTASPSLVYRQGAIEQSSDGKDIMGFFDLGVQEEASFLTTVRHTVLEGPLTVVRFSDSNRHEQGAYGKYWMYGSEVLEALAQRTIDRLIRDVRRRWAISNDWGDLRNCWVLRLPQGAELNAYWGFTKPQSRVSEEAAKSLAQPTTKCYAGGSIQLILSIGPRERGYITGPFSTLCLTSAMIEGR